jgi:uncharacterized Zn-finger protein
MSSPITAAVTTDTVSEDVATISTHVCTICSRAFTLKSQLTNHIKSHTKPEMCMYCPATFAHERDRNRHESAYVGESEYACRSPGCGSVFTRKDNMMRDMTKMHPGHSP